MLFDREPETIGQHAVTGLFWFFIVFLAFGLFMGCGGCFLGCRAMLSTAPGYRLESWKDKTNLEQPKAYDLRKQD